MRLNRLLALLGAALIVAGACSSGGTSNKPTIKIGSDGFYESKLVSEMYAQVLEKAGYSVERHLGIGARQVRVPAMESGQIDLAPARVSATTTRPRSPVTARRTTTPSRRSSPARAAA